MNMNYNKYIDHTILKCDATKDDITKLVLEAKEYSFASVCVNPCFVSYAKSLLEDSDVLVCTVVGFPLGANTTTTKVFETIDAIKNGADEIDMVINIGALKERNIDLVKSEISKIVVAAGNLTVKVIIESCLLSDEEIVLACQIAKEAGATFVKTSTGFSTGGATVEAVKLMKNTVQSMDVKASGGIRTAADMVKMIDSGATRIGTSAGVELIKELK